MAYCTKCGIILIEGEEVCRNCGQKVGDNIVENKADNSTINLSKTEPLKTEDPKTEAPRTEAPRTEAPKPIQPLKPQNMGGSPVEKQLSNGWKVFLTATTLLVPFIGPVLGIIMSLIYLSSPNLDSKSYGKALLILNVVYIGVCLVCCLAFMFLSMAGYMSDPAYFYEQFPIY